MEESTLQRSAAKNETIAIPKPQNRMNPMTQCVKNKAPVAREYTNKRGEADKVREAGRAKKRSIDFIPNTTESHNTVLHS